MSQKDKIQKLLVVALKPEWVFLKKHYDFENDTRLKNFFRLKDKADCGLLQIGCGLENSRFNFCRFLEIYDCESVLHFGSCGALVPELKVGDVFVASVLTDGNQRISSNEDNSAFLATSLARRILFSSKTVLKNRGEKLNCHAKFKADAVDMESFAIAKICSAKKIAYTSVRAVFDTLDDNLEAIGEPYDENGNLKTSKLVVNLIKNPKLILAVPELKRRADLVNERLAAVLKYFMKE